jgi:uncharacterized integral membrane protein
MDFTTLLIPLGIFGGLLGYPILQVLAIRRMRGGWLVLALLPLLVMIPVLFVTFQALSHGSNLWPIILIFVAPALLAYLIILLVAHARVQKRRHDRDA